VNPPRFYCCPITKGQVELTADEAHHLTSVFRLSVGATVELFDGAGALASAVVTAVEKGRATLTVKKLQVIPPSPHPRIVLAVSVPKADRFEWVISKCTELGVDRIYPVRFERTVKLACRERMVHRYQHLALAAAKQCRRLFLPRIDPPASLTDCLETLLEDYPHCRFLLGSLIPPSTPLINLKWTARDVIAFVGPEGGLTDQEIELIRRHQVSQVCLTDNILRVETAALAFAALLTAQRHAASPDITQ